MISLYLRVISILSRVGILGAIFRADSENQF